MQLSRLSASSEAIGTPSRTNQDTNSIYSQWTNVSVHSLEPETEQMADNETWMRVVTNLEEEEQENHRQHPPSRPASVISFLDSQNHHQSPVSTASSIITNLAAPPPCSNRADSLPFSPVSPHYPISPGSTLVNSQATTPHSPDGLTSRGERIEVYYPRGVTSSAGFREAQDQWLPTIQRALHYTFRNPSLLEEALESRGSGVTVVGNKSRAIPDGNLGLASVGKRSLELLLANQAYTFRLTKGESLVIHFLVYVIEDNVIDVAIDEMESQTRKTLHRMNFFEISKKTRIREFIRPPLPSQKKNYFMQLREDTFGFEDKTIIIAKAIKAIIGAIYIDRGQPAAEEVAKMLGLCFQIAR